MSMLDVLGSKPRLRIIRELTDEPRYVSELADQLEAGDELTISSDEWEIPFQFREPIEVEVEFIGDGSRELEVELEFEWADDDALPVE